MQQFVGLKATGSPISSVCGRRVGDMKVSAVTRRVRTVRVEVSRPQNNEVSGHSPRSHSREIYRSTGATRGREDISSSYSRVGCSFMQFFTITCDIMEAPSPDVRPSGSPVSPLILSVTPYVPRYCDVFLSFYDG